MKLIDNVEEFAFTETTAPEVKKRFLERFEQITSSEVEGKVVIEIKEEFVSPEEAAKILGMSRPWFLEKVMKTGKIESFPKKEGSTHRVLKLSDVKNYDANLTKAMKNYARDTKEAFKALASLEDE